MSSSPRPPPAGGELAWSRSSLDSRSSDRPGFFKQRRRPRRRVLSQRPGGRIGSWSMRPTFSLSEHVNATQSLAAALDSAHADHSCIRSSCRPMSSQPSAPRSIAVGLNAHEVLQQTAAGMRATVPAMKQGGATRRGALVGATGDGGPRSGFSQGRLAANGSGIGANTSTGTLGPGQEFLLSRTGR